MNVFQKGHFTHWKDIYIYIYFLPYFLAVDVILYCCALEQKLKVLQIADKQTLHFQFVIVSRPLRCVLSTRFAHWGGTLRSSRKTRLPSCNAILSAVYVCEPRWSSASSASLWCIFNMLMMSFRIYIQWGWQLSKVVAHSRVCAMRVMMNLLCPGLYFGERKSVPARIQTEVQHLWSEATVVAKVILAGNFLVWLWVRDIEIKLITCSLCQSCATFGQTMSGYKRYFHSHATGETLNGRVQGTRCRRIQRKKGEYAGGALED